MQLPHENLYTRWDLRFQVMGLNNRNSCLVCLSFWQGLYPCQSLDFDCSFCWYSFDNMSHISWTIKNNLEFPHWSSFLLVEPTFALCSNILFKNLKICIVLLFEVFWVKMSLHFASFMWNFEKCKTKQIQQWKRGDKKLAFLCNKMGEFHLYDTARHLSCRQ